MKHLIRSLLCLALFSTAAFSQTKLSSSRESGRFTYVYRITDQEAYEIAAKSSSVIDDSFLHTLVDSFYYAPGSRYTKNLEYGNYLHVRPVKSRFQYELIPVYNANLHFVNNRKDFQLSVTDLRGNPVTDAEVYAGKNKKVNYDPAAHLYVARKGAGVKVVRVRHQGINNFFTYEQKSHYEYKKPFFLSTIFRKRAPRVKIAPSAYKGYMVFNKPKYKPLDTVKFKAYLVSSNGKLIRNKQAKFELHENNGYTYGSYRGNDDDDEDEPVAVLDSIMPYLDGGYDYSFVITDSLDLMLDESYDIRMKMLDEKKWKEVLRGKFHYEEYELGSLKFDVRTDRDTHSPGSPVTVFMKARDENDLAVPDGRVEVTVTTNTISRYYRDKMFVSDTLWKTNVLLDPVGETKLTIPDSIFPKADLRFSMHFSFRNSNNESLQQNKLLDFALTDRQIKMELVKDSLKISAFTNGTAAVEKAMLSIRFMDGSADSTSIGLPAGISFNPLAKSYEVRLLNDGIKKQFLQENFSADISISAVQNRDSLTVLVDNVHRIPFWYTIFSGNSVLLKGYTSALDTVISHKGIHAAHVRINYFIAGKERFKEAAAIFQEKRLDVKLLSPEVVYPGQTVNMEVQVTDADQQPVPATDVTVYAWTSKFDDPGLPELPYFGKSYIARKQGAELETDDIAANGSMMMQWKRWGKQLGLDTIAYYQFVNTDDVYITREAIADTSISIAAPFVVRNGDIVPAQLVYIDGIPVYYSGAAQLKRYAFPVTPGKHRIEIRTAMLSIDAGYFDFEKGQKTIISINGRLDNERVAVKKMPVGLTVAEFDQLQEYMIRIHDNFNMQKTTLTTDEQVVFVNPPDQRSPGKDLPLGPFQENYMRFRSGNIDQTFIKEPAYTYTFLPGLLKQKSFGAGDKFMAYGSAGNDQSGFDYKAQVLKSAEIDQLWEEYLNLRSRNTVLFRNKFYHGVKGARLITALDTNMLRDVPYLKNILVYKNAEPDFLQVFPGNQPQNFYLEEGMYRILYLFRDNSYMTADKIVIRAGGINYFEWNNLKLMQADAMSKKIDQEIKSVKSGGYDIEAGSSAERISEQLNEKEYDQSLLTVTATGRILDSLDHTPSVGVAVRIKGFSRGTVTDVNGYFKIKVPKQGTLVFSYIGYDRKEIRIYDGDMGTVFLKPTPNSLDEVVVVGYGTQVKKQMTGSTSSITTRGYFGLAASPGISADKAKLMIRGISSVSESQKPLVLVDGLPFNGDVNDLDADNVADMSILKDAAATAIYGARGANGVVIIKTKKGTVAEVPESIAEAGGQSLRTNFSDYAIWQPRLYTDAAGKARFKVRFPDDITSWSAKLIAMNGQKQSGFGEFSIRSFKMLSANFVSPQFAVAGDSIYVLGKLMNYSNAEEKASRTFSYNGKQLLNNEISFKNAHIDTIAVVAGSTTDSLSFEYTMKQESGYFDGELRKIPLIKAGVQETKGYFTAMTGDTTVSHTFDSSLGPLHLRAEASVFPALLDEVDKLRRYEYLCNEQLASKLKALLLEKTVRKYLGNEFKEEKMITELIKKLQQNRRKEGTWGWWKDSPEEGWISLHVVESLLEAQKQGYSVNIDKDRLYVYLLSRLSQENHFDQLYLVKLMRLISDKYYIKDWVKAIEQQQQQQKQPSQSISLFQKLQLMQLKQQAGLNVDLKWLVGIRKQTMFGNMYWGETSKDFWDNTIQNTLLAYQILKRAGGHQEELAAIQRYFMEQRKDGQWRNTYESSLILETILPELMMGGKSDVPVSIQINGAEKITAFPYQQVFDTDKLTIDKKGKTPVYFTAYQQYHNPKPEKAGKDFKVKSWFEQKSALVTRLKAGTTAMLHVEVEVRADADYVMIEVPIPAGCSYENKVQQFWGVETHREYFKHKTAIFCTKLKQGTYKFSIQLMPRYSGNYTLNPAKAEMMYFPVFYGREGIRRLTIN